MTLTDPVEHAKACEGYGPIERPEVMDCESYTPGGHAVISLNHMTLSEAIKFAFVPRIAQRGDNVSPPLTLAHAGQIAAMLGADPEEPIVHATQYRRDVLTSGQLRVTEAEGTLVHKGAR